MGIGNSLGEFLILRLEKNGRCLAGVRSFELTRSILDTSHFVIANYCIRLSHQLLMYVGLLYFSIFLKNFAL